VIAAIALGLPLLGALALGLTSLRTLRKARDLRSSAATLAAWLAEEAALLEREGAMLAAALAELSLRLQLLQQRLSPAARLVASPLAAEGIRWSLRRLWGKPFKRSG
jgi:hypothetical protein